MAGSLQYAINLDYAAESDDMKHVSKLSTILVATIQEAKERISQIEYIFCSQLYCNFQSKCKSLQKIYLEAKNEAEKSWKEKEKDLLLQIEKLELEKQEALGENRCLKLEIEKALALLDEKVNSPPLKERNHQNRTDELDYEVRNNSKEVNEGLELQNRLLQMVPNKSSLIVDKKKQLKDYEEKTNGMLVQVKQLEKKIEELEVELKQKTEKVAFQKELERDLCRHLENLTSELGNCGQSLTEHDKEKKELVGKLESLEDNVSELQTNLRKKTEENEEGKMVRVQLLQQIDQNNEEISKQKQNLEEYEEKTNQLLAKVKKLEKNIEELEAELKRKTETIADKTELEKGLSKHLEKLMTELAKCGESQSQHEKEKKVLVGKLEHLEYNVWELQKNLMKKTEENEEGKVLQGKLLQQIDMNNKEILKQKQLLEEFENGRKLHRENSNGLQEKINELQENLSRSSKVAEEKDSYEKLLEKIELKEFELLSEKKKRRHLLDAYKRLKSQYNYLCTKSGLTEENMLLQIKLEDESGSLVHQQNPTTSPDFEGNHADTSAAVCEIRKVKIENELSDGLEDDKVGSDTSSAVYEIKKVKIENELNDGLENDKVVKSIPSSGFRSPSPNHTARKCPPSAKSAPVIGTKRPASRWIETRSRQSKDGPDPHDDFLNTPLENLRRTVNEKFHDLHIPVRMDLHPGSSDDETQDMNVDPGPENKQIQPPVAGQKGFKYVEPVRKKADRDNLKGVECKQCKKFYDAVLPNGGRRGDGNEQISRCEHHDGVSRHRYKYIPPMTPEGFWNIGFDSEI